MNKAFRNPFQAQYLSRELENQNLMQVTPLKLLEQFVDNRELQSFEIREIAHFALR